MAEHVAGLRQSESVEIDEKVLARFEPVKFDAQMVELVASTADKLGYSVRRMPSGAGHDAQMFAPNCPTAMIFVPSKDGISHNVREYSSPPEIQAGADVLLQVMMKSAE